MEIVFIVAEVSSFYGIYISEISVIRSGVEGVIPEFP